MQPTDTVTYLTEQVSAQQFADVKPQIALTAEHDTAELQQIMWQMLTAQASLSDTVARDVIKAFVRLQLTRILQAEITCRLVVRLAFLPDDEWVDKPEADREQVSLCCLRGLLTELPAEGGDGK